MSVRRVSVSIAAEALGGVLITEDHSPDRGWVLQAEVPPDVLIDLTGADRVEVVLSYEGGASRLVSSLDELSVDAQPGRLHIQGHGGLDPWPDEWFPAT